MNEAGLPDRRPPSRRHPAGSCQPGEVKRSCHRGEWRESQDRRNAAGFRQLADRRRSECSSTRRSSSRSSPSAPWSNDSTNSTVDGLTARRAIWRPAIRYGETAWVAPASISLEAAASELARATITRSGLSARAVSVTKVLSASVSTAVISPAARSIPAARRVASSVASPSTTRKPSSWADLDAFRSHVDHHYITDFLLRVRARYSDRLCP